MRTAKTLIRLGGQVILSVLSCCGSFWHRHEEKYVFIWCHQMILWQDTSWELSSLFPSGDFYWFNGKTLNFCVENDFLIMHFSVLFSSLSLFFYQVLAQNCVIKCSVKLLKICQLLTILWSKIHLNKSIRTGKGGYQKIKTLQYF